MKEPFAVHASQARAIGNFEDMVRAFALEMTTWQQHSAKVGREDGYDPYPPPQAHKMVAQAISLHDDGTAWVPNFVIIDDTPDAGVMLRQHKNSLLTQVMAMETNEKVAIFPPGKRRLYEVKESAVIVRDRDRRIEVEKKNRKSIDTAMSVLSSEERSDGAKVHAVLNGGMTQEQIDAEVLEGRAPEDVTFMTEAADIRRRIDAASMHSAQVCHDIEDLTEQTIAGWTIPPFPSVVAKYDGNATTIFIEAKPYEV